MRGAPSPAVLMVALCALAGCGDDPADDRAPDDPRPTPGTSCPAPSTPDSPPGAPAPLPLPVREGFEATPDGAVPPLWTATDGTWAAVPASSARAGLRELAGQGDADPGFSALLVGPAGDLGDFDLEVSFQLGCVEHPHGIGVVLHVSGPDDYQIIRYSASESAWDFFTVRGGERVRHEAAQVGNGTDPAPGAWTDLRVTSEAGRVRAFDGQVLVLDSTLDEADAATGQVGLFLRGTSDARFDDVRVDELGLPLA